MEIEWITWDNSKKTTWAYKQQTENEYMPIFIGIVEFHIEDNIEVVWNKDMFLLPSNTQSLFSAVQFLPKFRGETQIYICTNGWVIPGELGDQYKTSTNPENIIMYPE